MADFIKNSFISSMALPVEIVFHPSWWHKHTGITFDEDFFYHPQKRVESEQRMEKELHDRFGEFGLGQEYKEKLPEIGAVHIAAGYIISEMLGCKVEYTANASPQVLSAGMDHVEIDIDVIFKGKPIQKVQTLIDSLKTKHGYVRGDINWGGVLNVAIDLLGEKLFMDFFIDPKGVSKMLLDISQVIDRFVSGIQAQTNSSSISVNRMVKHLKKPVFLHSECSHTMISTEQYEEFLLPIDKAWSMNSRPFGIHYCGKDPHRYAESFAKIGALDFLDVGWGGDIKELRKHLPNTFLNIRLDPVTINAQSEEEIRETITTLVNDSNNPYLTGVCCINMDDQVEDGKVIAVLQAVSELKKQK